MPKRVKNKGLSACKSPEGISVLTVDGRAKVCVARQGAYALRIAIYQDGCDTPTVVEVPLIDNPYIFNPNKPHADFTMPRSITLADEIGRDLDPEMRRAMSRLAFNRKPKGE